MSDLFKSTYNPDALSCITTRRRPPSAPARGQGANAKCPGIWRGVPRRRLPSWAVSQSAREAGGGFPCPAGGSVGAGPRAGGGRKVPRNLAGGSPAAFAQLGRLPKCPGGWRGVSCLAGGSVGTGRHPAQPAAGAAPHLDATTYPAPPWQITKREGYVPLPHHVTPRPSQLKAAQSSKDYCGLTYVTTTRRCGSSPSEWVMTSSLSTRARCMILRS